MGRVKQLNRNQAFEHEQAGLLISLLVRYPEILKIIYDPKDKCISFTFGIKTRLEAKFPVLKQMVLDHIETLLFLNHRNATIIDLNVITLHEFCLLEYKRDLRSLEKNELNIIINLLKKEFVDKLLIEDMDSIEEDILWLHEEMINNFLLNLEGATNSDVLLVAFRENGRVFVFNKN